MRALREREDRVCALEQEKQSAYNSVKRLQESIRQRDDKICDLSKCFREHDPEIEDIRESFSWQKRDHSRIVDELSRTLSEVVAHEVELRHNMERAVWDKAGADVLMKTLQELQERVQTLDAEREKLRRQVHELQPESMDKEVKHAQASRQRAQDKEAHPLQLVQRHASAATPPSLAHPTSHGLSRCYRMHHAQLAEDLCL